jgi:dihydroxy-acid dehydratase
MEVDEAELDRRRADWTAPPVEGVERGYLRLYVDHVQGADEGADFDFLRGGSGSDVPRRAF